MSRHLMEPDPEAASPTITPMLWLLAAIIFAVILVVHS